MNQTWSHFRAEAQVQYRNCAESALTIHVYFKHCVSAHGRALKKKVRLGIHLRREWDCILRFYDKSNAARETVVCAAVRIYGFLSGFLFLYLLMGQGEDSSGYLGPDVTGLLCTL